MVEENLVVSEDTCPWCGVKGGSPQFNLGRKGNKCVKLLKVRMKSVLGGNITNK
jgi:hypothetical protein